MFSVSDGGTHDLEHQRLQGQLGTYLVGSGLWADRPTAPAVNQRYYATDLTSEFYWSGTALRWISTVIYGVDLGLDQALPVATGAVAGVNVLIFRGSISEVLMNAVAGVRFAAGVLNVFPSVAHTATNYVDWASTYINKNGAGGALTISGAANSQGNTGGVWSGYNIFTSTQVIADPNISFVQLVLTLRGAAPVNHNLYGTFRLNYQLLGT